MYAETLQSLCEQSGGILLTKDIVNAGVPSSYLTAFLREGKLERAGHGVYITPDAMEDKMFTLQARKNRLVYSHDTALYLHDLTDRDPLTYSVTVPTGYNTKRLTEEGLRRLQGALPAWRDAQARSAEFFPADLLGRITAASEKLGGQKE